MNKIAVNYSDDQKATELEIDYYSWLSDVEEELFDHSGFEKVADWVESFYGVSINFWMDTKQTLKLLEQSGPKVHQKLAPPQTYEESVANLRNNPEPRAIKLLQRFVRSDASGNTIILMKISRRLLRSELDAYWNANCTFLKDCKAFAREKRICSFSCIICPQAHNLKKE